MLAPLWAQTCAHFFDVATNPLLSAKANEILTRVVQMIIQAIIHMIIQMIVLGTQNRCFSKGFCAEGSLHHHFHHDSSLVLKLLFKLQALK